MTFDPKSFNVPRGGRVSVTVTADRRDGFDGPIDVELRGLPPGLSASPGRIPAGADTTVLMLAAAADASFEGRRTVLRSLFGKDLDVPGLVSLALTGTATIDGRTVTRDAASRIRSASSLSRRRRTWSSRRPHRRLRCPPDAT